ncbi:MAG TPA: hypothetical protein VFR09_08385 [Alphaproteobacteria bacterium]|nr:hypothetical protein [Alphaproteobacteria bacterium]
MKKLALAILALSIAMLPAAPAHAYWGHGGPRYSFNFGYYGGGPAYYPYPAYYAPYYYAPPPTVVYTPPPTVVYSQPAQQVVVQQPAPASVVGNQTSPDFTGPNGEQCREYQSGATHGTACLQPDGTWRIVQ